MKPTKNNSKKGNSTFFALIPSSIIEPVSTSSTGITNIKMSMRKSRKIMDSWLLKLKKKEMNPRKRLMWRTIKSLKQKLMKKEEKIHSLKNLLKDLRYDNKL